MSVFSRHTKYTGKIRNVYISSTWIEMVFIIEGKYEDNKIMTSPSTMSVP